MKIRFIKALKQKRILNWIVSYLLTLIIPICMVAISYMCIDGIFQDKIVQINTHGLENSASSIDDIINDIEMVSHELVTKKELERVAGYDKTLDASQVFNLTRMEYVWWTYAPIETYIEDCYMYMPRKSQVFSNSRMYNADDFFAVNSANKSSEAKNEWIEVVLSKQKSGFVCTEKNNAIYYVQPNTIAETTAEPYSVIVKLNVDALMSYANRIYEGKFFICNDNMIIGGNIDKGLQNDIIASNHTKNIVFETSDNDCIVAKIKSKYANLYYGCVITKDAYFGPLKTIRSLMLLSIILSIILGGFVINKSVRQNNRPIRELFNLFKNNEIKPNNDLDDYEYISSAVVELLKNKNMYQSRLTSQNDILKTSILSDVIEGRRNEKYSYEKQFEIADLKTNGNLYAVIVFYIDDCEKIFFEQTDNLSVAEKNAKYIVNNIGNELLNRSFNTELFENHGLMIAVVNFDDSQASTAITDICSMLCEMSDFIRKEFNFKLIASISDIHYSLSGVSEAYSEAVIGIEQLLSGEGNVIRYTDIKLTDADKYLYTGETEMQLLKLLENRDYKRARLLIKSVLDGFRKIKGASLHIIMYYTVDFLSTFLKAATFLNNEHLYNIIKGSGKNVLECSTIHSVLNTFENAVGEFMNELESTDMNETVNDVYGKIKIYIDNNYDDVDLNVNKLASIFDINASVLSNQFKMNCNISLSVYIRNKRIEEAKILLKETNKKVQEIAVDVGFGSARTFQRVFTQDEGVSPSKWREMYK